MGKRFGLTCLALGLSITVAGGVGAAEISPRDALYAAVGERLALMRDVAAWKWIHGVPIEDAKREGLVIQSAVETGLRFQIRPAATTRLFRTQIEAAKDIQRYWFDRWQADGPPTASPDLERELRPLLLGLGERILERAAQGVPDHDFEQFLGAVSTPGLSRARAQELFDALRGLSRFESRLDQILETGRLRVGTTGDYRPFSFAAEDEAYEGVDIDLARDLARSLDVELEFVGTSWPTLMADLAAGRFDVGMSGISRTLSRARLAFFSVPYWVGGKMPIARCAEVDRYDSLAKIDKPGVRVIVNPGGTNEAFVDSNLTRAEKHLHPDNRTLFDALVAGEADVMITDLIEVEVQSRRHPELCGTTERPLTRQEKAFLLPRDPALKVFVDTWLEQRLAEGTVDGLFRRALGR